MGKFDLPLEAAGAFPTNFPVMTQRPLASLVMRTRENPHWGKRASRDPATNRAAVTLPAWTWHAATLLSIVVLAATQQWIAAAIISGLAIVGVFLVRRDRHGGDD